MRVSVLLNKIVIKMLNHKQMSELFEFDDYQRRKIASIFVDETNLLKALYKIDEAFTHTRAPYPCRIFNKLYSFALAMLINEIGKQYTDRFIDDDEFNSQMKDVMQLVNENILKHS